MTTNHQSSLNVTSLTRDVQLASTTLGGDVGYGGEADRLSLLAAARELVTTLEKPELALFKIAKGPVGHAALRTAFRMRIFEVFPPSERATATDLADRTGTEHQLMTRILRALPGIGIFVEVDKETYCHNALSKALCHPLYQTLVMGMCETTTMMTALPDYLSSIAFRNPSHSEHALFQYYSGTQMNKYEYMHTQPQQLAMFSAYQAAATEVQSNTLQAIINAFLPDDNLQTGDDEVLLVDVGGGRGETISKVRNQRPDLPGRIIVQDLPKEIEGRVPAPGIEAMPHDFFTPQPIAGAHVYFFCHVFHDWPDSACRRILANTTPAMTRGESRIVIVDQVVPEVKASAFVALMDISMMASAGTERTERQWRTLLEGAGLAVRKINHPEPGSLTAESTIEAVLA
ncbi:hypothetical protein MMC20_006105 [Loxospora ochrophaea]|nr:hypothetical protein [Loxospora ochrophaea]